MSGEFGAGLARLKLRLLLAGVILWGLALLLFAAALLAGSALLGFLLGAVAVIAALGGLVPMSLLVLVRRAERQAR
jgi:hypothetical protein